MRRAGWLITAAAAARAGKGLALESECLLSGGGARNAEGHKASPAGYEWLGIPPPGSAGVAMDLKNPERVAIPPALVKAVFAVLEPGATLYVTDAPIREETTGPSLNVLNSDPPPGTPPPAGP